MNDDTFELHPRLAADTIAIGALPLCRVLLMNDKSFPWCLAVPQRNAIRELHELSKTEQAQLMEEVTGISAAMQDAYAADKMNIAALGNQVPQLHLHIIARFESDPAWPAPVWGKFPPQPYSPSEQEHQRQRLHEALGYLHDFRMEV